MKIDIRKVSWRGKTERAYAEAHENILSELGKMEAQELADASALCSSIDNPYAYEILDRAALFDAFRGADSYAAAQPILNRAAHAIGAYIQ